MCLKDLPLQLYVSLLLPVIHGLDVLLQVFDLLQALSSRSLKFAHFRGQVFMAVFHDLSASWREEKQHVCTFNQNS